MPQKKKEKRSESLSSKDKKILKEIEEAHLSAKNSYMRKVKEIEQDYLSGDLTYMQSVREVIKMNKAYNSLIRNLIKKLNEYEDSK